MSAQDDATGAGDRLFNDLQTARLLSSPSPVNKSLVRVTPREKERERERAFSQRTWWWKDNVNAERDESNSMLGSRNVSLVDF